MLGAVARVFRRPVFCAWVAAIALFSGIGAGLAQQPASSGDVPTSVVPPVQPTEVSISAFLIGLSRVSEPSAAFPVFDVEMLAAPHESHRSTPVPSLQEQMATLSTSAR